jgi:hypothetical protein
LLQLQQSLLHECVVIVGWRWVLVVCQDVESALLDFGL